MIQQAYVEGVSTRRVDDLVKSLGCDGISKSQVSRPPQADRDLDQVVENFLGRPLDGSAYPYVWLDALIQKVREGGRIVNVSVVVATGVNSQGQREILGMDVGASEDGAFWLAFLRSLNARGLSGVELVISDAHQGLKNAIATVFAGAGWSASGGPHSLHDQPTDPGAQTISTRRGHHGPHHLQATLAGRGPRSSRPGDRTTARTLPPGGRGAGRRFARHPGLHRLPGVPLAEALVQQPVGTPEQGDPPAYRRGGYLPQPGGDPASGGRPPLADWPSSTTNGPKAAATSPSPMVSTPRRCHPATSLRQLPEQHQQG